MKKIIAIICMVTILVSVAGCSNRQNAEAAAKTQPEVGQAETAQSKDTDSDEDYQITMPQKGETVVILHVKDYGDIKIKLFPQDSPKSVENFIGLASQGYYDGVIFHRVIQDFMIQGGDPTGTGSGGDSLFGGTFENEYSEVLLPVRGALCMARRMELDTNLSQFFIVQAGAVSQEMMDYYMEMGADFSEFARQKFLRYGGAPHLSIEPYTVFGQVYEGMDVVDKIASVKTSEPGRYDRPVEDVVIEYVEIEEYGEPER